jgi:hypothetical protein
MRNRYTKGLVSYGGNRRIFRPQGDPLSSRVSDRLATPLALASSWKSKGAARRIVKDKGSGLIKPIETHQKELTSAKNWKILIVFLPLNPEEFTTLGDCETYSALLLKCTYFPHRCAFVPIRGPVTLGRYVVPFVEESVKGLKNKCLVCFPA